MLQGDDGRESGGLMDVPRNCEYANRISVPSTLLSDAHTCIFLSFL